MDEISNGQLTYTQTEKKMCALLTMAQLCVCVKCVKNQEQYPQNVASQMNRSVQFGTVCQSPSLPLAGLSHPHHLNFNS